MIVALLLAITTAFAADEPVMTVKHKHFAEVLVHKIAMPDGSGLDGPHACTVRFQVSSQGQMRITQEDCATEVMETTQAAIVKWEIEAGKPEPGQYFAVFRVRFEFSGPSGEVWLVVPEDDLVSITKPQPSGIMTHRKARAKRRVNPEFPSTAKTEDGEIRCTIAVDVDVNGRGKNLEVSGCDEAYAAEALKAVKQWRWYPERRNGKEEVVAKTIQIAFSR